MNLTREQILNEPAGRQMDAWVAENVMGLVPCANECHAKGEMLPCHASPEYPDQGAETHAYSTDIAAAWEVAEKMQELGYGLAIWTYPKIIQIYKTDQDGAALANVKGETIPDAICRATLLAKLEDK